MDLIALLGDSFYTFAHGARTITRAGGGVHYETPLGVYEALSSEIAMKALQPAMVRVPAGRIEPLAMSSHAGEEFIHVLKGTVRFIMEPYSPTVLEPGDSVHFDSLMRHGFVAVGDEGGGGRPDALGVCVRQGEHQQDDARFLPRTRRREETAAETNSERSTAGGV